jgi:hypothetical protein
MNPTEKEKDILNYDLSCPHFAFFYDPAEDWNYPVCEHPDNESGLCNLRHNCPVEGDWK